MSTQVILDFIKEKKEKLCVLATVGVDNTPECAVVGYAAKVDGTILINTNKNSRKVANLRIHKKVALVIGWSFDAQNVQYEGKAEIIELDNPAYVAFEEFFFTSNPGAKKFKSPDTILIKITPSWIRMTDLTKSPPITEEAHL